MPSAPNITAHLTLHRYFLNASRNRSLFFIELNAGHQDSPHTLVHLLLWYACLHVVVEGWRTERINYAPVTALLRDGSKADVLQGCRNAVFHFSPSYVDPRVETLFREPDFVAWVHDLHDAMSAFFLVPGQTNA